MLPECQVRFTKDNNFFSLSKKGKLIPNLGNKRK